jgi:stage II sporulation SpoD-like protein/WD40 repeat protein
MFLTKTLRIILILLPALLCLMAIPAFAQSGDTPPRRLTFDGHSTPQSWTTSGLLLIRPGAVIPDVTGTRIANELWLANPLSGGAQRLSTDTPLSPRAPASSTPSTRIFIVDDGSLQPELWLSAPDGSNARMLLKGDSEFFGAPVLSPDGTRFAFTRMPSGSETHAFNEIWVSTMNGANLSLLIAEASSPVWSPDGNEIAFEHRGDMYVSNSNLVIGNWPPPITNPQLPMTNQPSAITPPATIRVLHVQGNADFSNTTTCRPTSLTVGSIMTISFEAYVSYVVPIEASPSNPAEKLKAQAVASRTYAWQRINPANPYDVTDWTDTQAMCDLRADPRTDAATNATAGQYIAYNGGLISALYAAESSDPTKSCPFGGGCQYLQAVDDPVSFGQKRNGHGGGLSQNGATRWAQSYGWSYIQILTHYYTGVTIEGPTNFGSLVAPWQNWYVTSNRARIIGNASNGSTFNIFASGVGLNKTQVATSTLLTSLDLGTLPEQALGSLVMTGNLTTTSVTTLTLGIDRTPPTGTLTLPTFSTSLTVTAQLSGTDIGPSGYAGFGLSNNWIWEGENQLISGAGAVVSDSAALNGSAIFAPTGSSGVWYGPYTFDLPLGRAYRVYFRLKTNDNATTNELAKLDVVADGATPIGIKHIYGTDFRAANTYQEFYVDFNFVTPPTLGVEFRVDFPGNASLWLDRVLVATYPTNASSTAWVLPPGETSKKVIAKFTDNAQNVSADVSATVFLSDTTTPYFVDSPSPNGWLTSTAQTIITRAGDDISGLNVNSAIVRTSSDGVMWSNPVSAIVSGMDGTTNLQMVTGTVVFSDGINMHAQFQIADMQGLTGTSALYTFKIDSTPPVVAITSPVTASLSFVVNWSGFDATSGLASFDAQSRDLATGVWRDWQTATSSTSASFFGADGHTYQFRVRARDQAGNLSAYSDASNATTTIQFIPKAFIYLPLIAR